MSGPLVAVIDGDTDKSGKLFSSFEGPVTSGRFAASVLAAAVESLLPNMSPVDAVGYLTAALAVAVEDVCGPVAPHERPSASIVVLDTVARRVWRVGDCPFRVDAVVWDAKKNVDRIASDFRAAFLAAIGSAGTDVGACGVDVGREAILPLLRIQSNLANVPGEFGYGSLNGTVVPAEFIEVVELPADVQEVVLASDGYPSLPATLAEAEADLADLVAADPYCVGPLRATKGLVPGVLSFDDRSWVRVTFGA